MQVLMGTNTFDGDMHFWRAFSDEYLIRSLVRIVTYSLCSSLIALIICLGCQNVFAGPPFFTDDPEPIDFKHWEFYIASQYLHTNNDSSGTAPHIEINYGVYPNFQIHVIAPIAFDHPKGFQRVYGYGDTELGLKYRFIQEAKYLPQIGTFPLLEAPTGDANRSLGNGRAQVFFPIWFQKSLDSWTTYGGGGYWVNPGSGNKNWFFAGWLLQRDFSKYLTLGGEIFHRTPDEVNGKSGTGFTLGGQFNYEEYYHLLFSAGRDFSGNNKLTTYLAFQLTF